MTLTPIGSRAPSARGAVAALSLLVTLGLVVACGTDSSVPVITPGPPGAEARTDVEAAPTTRSDAPNRADDESSGTTTTAPPVPDGVVVPPAVEQPNVLMIMTDDQTVEAMRVLQRINARIGGEGTTFTNSVTSYPLCCPSRATFYSGQYAHNHGVLWNALPTGGFTRFQDWETAFPAALQQAGYHTAHVGKYLNGYGVKNPTEVPAGWDDFRGMVDPSTGQYFGFSVNDNGVIDTYPAGTEQERGPYQTDVVTDLALEQMAQGQASNKPWLVNVSYLAPHAEFGYTLAEYQKNPGIVREDIEQANTAFDIESPVPAPRHLGAFKDEPLPDKANYDAATEGQVVPQWRPELDEARRSGIERNYRAELESLLAVDEGVDRLLTQLDELGVADDTLVVFTSDNGYFHGEHREYQGKYYPWEESLAVPLLMRGPGVAQGVTVDSVVANIDLAPTFLDVAGAKALRQMDGRSLVPLMANPAASWDRPILLEGFQPPAPFRPQYQGVRTNRYSYIEYTGGGLQGTELYDLHDDPEQLRNLVLDPDRAEVVAGLRSLVTDLRQCGGPDCDAVQTPEPARDTE
ncbi:MAG: sulfatase [Microthrixaceae bacterium]